MVRFTYPSSSDTPRIGLLTGRGILDPGAARFDARDRFPSDPVELLASAGARDRCEAVLRDPAGVPCLALEDVRLLAPVPRPTSFRDFYAFEEHVRNARARRGLPVPEEWYRFPAFYFSNPSSIAGPGDGVTAPRGSLALDFELEIGCVIGRTGRDISLDEASSYIAGYCVLNDWSARDIQAEEMKVGLGPAKGKDFATSIGPALVTPDEISSSRSGKGYDLSMEARRDGVVLSRGTWSAIHWSFEEMIARASRDAEIHAGDLLGSGTVGTGCILELGPEDAGGWLVPGNRIELEIEGLGVLANTVV